MQKTEKWTDIEFTGCSVTPRYIRPVVTASGDGSPATITIRAFRDNRDIEERNLLNIWSFGRSKIDWARIKLQSYETKYTRRRRRAFRVFLRVVGALAIAAGVYAYVG